MTLAYEAVTARFPENEANRDSLSRLAALCVVLMDRAMRRAAQQQGRRQAGAHHHHEHHEDCDDPEHCAGQGHDHWH